MRAVDHLAEDVDLFVGGPGRQAGDPLLGLVKVLRQLLQPALGLPKVLHAGTSGFHLPDLGAP